MENETDESNLIMEIFPKDFFREHEDYEIIYK